MFVGIYVSSPFLIIFIYWPNYRLQDLIVDATSIRLAFVITINLKDSQSIREGPWVNEEHSNYNWDRDIVNAIQGE